MVKKVINKQTMPYLLICPTLLYYLFFWVRPVLKSFVESFTNDAGRFTFDHYIHVFSEVNFGPALGNTALIAFFSVTLEFFLALFLAILINKKFKGAGILLFIALIPMALPPIAVGAMWKTGFTAHGWVNSLLSYLSIEKINWLGGGKFSLMSLIIIIDSWQVIPSVMIILLAGLQNLPREAQEAGYVFGATKFQVLKKITIPMLKPTIVTAVILRLISAIQIWLVIVLLVGFDRIPVLLERVVYYKEELYGFDKIAVTYSVLVSVIVTIAAVIYLKASGVLEREEAE